MKAARRALSLIWIGIEGALFAVLILPFYLAPADAQIAVFGWVGRRLSALPVARRRVGENLRLIRPDASDDEVKRLCAGVCDNFMRVQAEYQRIASLIAQPERRRVSGVEHLLAAKAAGSGVILVSAHFGNWEMARIAAREAGVETGIFYRAFNNPIYDRLGRIMVSRIGEPVLLKGGKGMRDMVRHLRRGGAIMLLLDQRLSRGASIPFLGHDAPTGVAVAVMALKTGAAMIPVSARRCADRKRFDIRFEAPIEGDDAIAMMREVNARIGAWVERDPEQWFWLHRRWRQARQRRYRSSDAAG